MPQRTDLALEAREIHAENLPGLSSREDSVRGVTALSVQSEEASATLGKPMGHYVTLSKLDNAETILASELRRFVSLRKANRVLVVGLGNRAMTPDAIGPKTVDRILVTRHLHELSSFSKLCAVSVIAPGVLGRTGMEAQEIVRGICRSVMPDLILAVDALAARRLTRVCASIQICDAGIVPGSGVGNQRAALNHKTLGVPVIAIGVPTVVDAETLALDLLEEANAVAKEVQSLQNHAVMVTPRDIDAQVESLSRSLAMGINLALYPTLSREEIEALLA